MVKTHLLDYFEDTVEKRSSSVAVRHNDQNITFNDLQDKARKLAAYLISKTDEVTNRPIAVFLTKEINTVIADIGIMYSSNPFMNLDIKTPKERIMNIFDLVKPIAVITNKKYSKAHLWN